MVREHWQQASENVRYWDKCINNCGKVIRNKMHPNTAFYWKKYRLCRECFLQTEKGSEYQMVKGKVVKK